MSKSKIEHKCIIMAGGKGTRLWPVSRKHRPKQFQAIVSDKTMLQETYLRLRKKFAVNDIYISTSIEYVSEVEREILEIPKKNIIAEPAARGTASSIALAISVIMADNPDVIISVFPADHVIRKEKTFLNAINTIENFLQKKNDKIVTFGIVPNYPEIGYGYINIKKSSFSSGDDIVIFPVKRFVEKPDLATAQKYVNNGDFFWNSGMYMFFLPTMVNKFNKYLPDTFKKMKLISSFVKKDEYKEVLHKEYPKMDKINIEYAIIENDSDIVVMPLDVGWSDIGSWASLKDSFVSDSKKHFVKGKHVDYGSEDLLVYGSSKRLVTTIGLKNIIIVDTEDTILVCNKEQSQMVSEVVNKIDLDNKETNQKNDS